MPGPSPSKVASSAGSLQALGRMLVLKLVRWFIHSFIHSLVHPPACGLSTSASCMPHARSWDTCTLSFWSLHSGKETDSKKGKKTVD